MPDEWKTRGVRGAITVEENTHQAIESATVELLKALIAANNLQEEDISSIIFTLTTDLNAEFPAKIARIYFKWNSIPMMCTQEIPVPGSIDKCIRVLITVNTTRKQAEIKHIYQGRAKSLRPDLADN